MGGNRRNPRVYWRTAFTVHERSGTTRRFWESAADVGIGAAVVGVPGAEPREGPPLLIVPGAQEIGGFIGDNVGMIVAAGAAQAGTLPWPYESAAPDVAEAVRNLRPDAWSDWILLELPSPDGRRGFFRVHAAGEDEVFVSPVYRRGTPARRYAEGVGEALLYVPDDPSWASGAGVSSELLYSHVRDLTAVRAQIAARLAARPGGSVLVYYEPLLALLEQTARRTEGDDESDRVRASAYEEIDDRLAAIVAGGSGRHDVVLIGREPRESKPGTPSEGESPVVTGFVASTAQDVSAFSRVSDGRIPLDRLGADLLAFYDGRSAVDTTRDEDASRSTARRKTSSEKAERAFSSRSLRRLGLLRASSTATPVRRDSVTESSAR
jgi:hypothetical protein